ncbi:ATP-dependent DNA helicase [Mycobacterium asiaticum]|uniref:UvrD-helicase domain-containing protein n=1 Tax=Mycobacterium asiaticum TaxID=1790 RepID=UPI0007EFAACF|nr:ATP-dependent helicase [Mycobacterium asiaticum]OBK92767.1 ATP-dependent DNA helicase [Mycobacterium asiaticum]
MGFTWKVGALTDEQEDVVNHPGSIFVIACPGSGKTRTLTYKVANELAKLDSHKRFVIAITYTHKAADEIEERLTGLGVGTEQLWIGTIHSFCLEWILKPYQGYHPQLARGFSVINSHESELILTRLCHGMGVTYYDCDFYFTGTAYKLGCPNPNKHHAIHQVLAAYFDELRTDTKIDFEMILQYAYEILRAKPMISKILSGLFKFIAMDEYQDTKLIQYEILMSVVKASNGRTRTLIVGDPNQEIYTSLGGYAMTAEEVGELANRTIEVKQLSKNFRSSARIVDYFENFNTVGTVIESSSADKHYPSEITLNKTVTMDGLSAEITQLITHSVFDLGIKPSEICVLAPWWTHLAAMTRSLVARLPQYEFDGPGLVPFARDVDNFWYKTARIALTDASPGLYVRRLKWAREMISDISDGGINVAGLSSRELLRASNSIGLSTQDGLDYLAEYFEQLMSLLGVRFRDSKSLSEQYDAFFTSSEMRIDRLEKEGAPHIRDIAIFRRVFSHRSGITVSTIHGVKGGEFDTVIAYGLLQDVVPHFRDIDGDRSAKKLLYVIASRARKNLHLIAESNRPRRFGSYSITRVLDEVDYEYTVH